MILLLGIVNDFVCVVGIFLELVVVLVLFD